MKERKGYVVAAWIKHAHTQISQEDGSAISVFVFDASQPNRRTYLSLAKNALRKLRTVRHPDVLKFLDAVETETTVYIMTERVRPLAPAIQERASKSAQEKEDWLLWGLHRISVSHAKTFHPRWLTGA